MKNSWGIWEISVDQNEIHWGRVSLRQSWISLGSTCMGCFYGFEKVLEDGGDWGYPLVLLLCGGMLQEG